MFVVVMVVRGREERKESYLVDAEEWQQDERERKVKGEKEREREREIGREKLYC